MNLVINIFQRLFGSPKTTAGGVIAGSGLAVAVSAILDQAGCQFSNVQWWEIMGMVFGGPALIGGLGTDNGKTVVPISPLTGPGGGIGAILLAIMLMGMTACASYIDYGNGRYGVTRVSEERSPFGTNAGFAYLDNCEGRRANPGATLEFIDCHAVTPLNVISSQGQGGQVLSGALNGLGFGLGSAFSGVSSGASSTSSAVSSATAGTKGH